MNEQFTQPVSLTDSLRSAGYCLQEDDLPQAARVMAAAFGDDPAIRYLLGGEAMGRDDWRYFLTVLRAVYGRCVLLSMDDTVQDLLVLFPPALQTVPAVPFFLHGGVGLCRFFGPALFARSLNYENNCQRIKRRFRTPDMWYCMCFVVQPGLQGQGNGSRLIRPALQVLDARHAPLYLETHKAVNTRIYEHLGFHMADISVIPGTETTQYAMLRAGKD